MTPPDDHDLDEELRGHLAISVKEHIERGADPEAARLAALRELGYVPAVRESMRQVWYQPLVRGGRGARPGHPHRVAIAAARQGPGRHRRGDAGPGHWRQRRDVQRRARSPAASAGQSRRGSPDLHPPERARPRRREHHLLGARAPGSALARHRVQRLRRLLHHRLHADRLRRATRRQGWRRRRLVLRCHGASPAAGPAAQCGRRCAQRRGGGGSDVSLLEHDAGRRSDRGRQDDPPRHAHRHRGWRPRAVGAVSGRHRNHRQRRHQPAPLERDDGDGADASHDGALRPPEAGRHARRGACRAEGGA